MNKAPAFQFYPKDWRTDTAPLTLAAKGAWIDLLCAMWFSQTKGELSLTWTGYSRIIGATVDQTKAVISELIDLGICEAFSDDGNVTCNANVTNCNKNVTLRNRRMYREEQIRINTRLRVEKHREKKTCNANVTPSRARSSSSPSPTTKENISLERDTKESVQESQMHPPAIDYADRYTAEGIDRRKEALDVLHYLNERCGKAYDDGYPGIRHIIERLNENFAIDDLKQIIDTKLCDPHFQKNRNLLSPDTLFRKENAAKYRYEKPEDYTHDAKTMVKPKHDPETEEFTEEVIL